MDLNAVILLLAFIGYGLIGFIDDYIIVVKKDNQGLKPKTKFLMQSILAVVFFLLYRTNSSLSLWIPIWDKTIPLGFLYFFLIFIMFTAETNAVNLTDGLDGLCAGQMIIALVPFVVFAFLQGLTQIAYILILVIAALLGYLKFNKHPAQIFMGDTGSLALGAGLTAAVLLTRAELLIPFAGFVFVMESASVIIQVVSFQTTGKRVFRMSPIHHHFELGGMKETRVVHMFWLIALICCVIAFCIMKIG